MATSKLWLNIYKTVITCSGQFTWLSHNLSFENYERQLCDIVNAIYLSYNQGCFWSSKSHARKNWPQNSRSIYTQLRRYSIQTLMILLKNLIPWYNIVISHGQRCTSTDLETYTTPKKHLGIKAKNKILVI